MYSVPGRTYFSRMSHETGFKSDSLEKVYRLMAILEKIQDTSELAGRLALKGGTAIQGMVFGFSRLSVDIDFNYIGSIDKKEMEKDRAEIRRVLLYLFEDLGYSIEHPRTTYAEEQFNAHFTNIGGGPDRLKLEINYLERLPVGGLRTGLIEHPFEGLGGIKTLSYRPEELFGGKMRALILRGTPRDLYDADKIARSMSDFDQGLLRKISLFYLSMYDQDVRYLNTQRIEAITSTDVRNNLQPLLSSREKVDVNELKEKVLPLVDGLLDLTSSEQKYFDDFYNAHEVEQNVLFDGFDISGGLSQHPAIVWRLSRFEKGS